MANFERQLQVIGMRAVDEISDRLADAEDLLGGKASKLARKWAKLDSEQKEHIVELCFGAATALVAAISAINSAGSGKRKKAVKKLGKAALAEAASAVSGNQPDLKKLKKKAKKAARTK